jgi:hypothetical protein
MKIKEDGDREKSTVHVNKQSFIGNLACLLHSIFSIPILRDITSRRSYYIYELKQQLEKAN